MRVLETICLVILTIYIAEKTFCYIYCFAKKKRDIAKSKCQTHASIQQNQTGIKWRIKQIAYGWILCSINRLGRVPFQKYRLFILKHIYLMDLADNVVIYHGFHIRAPWNIKIGKGTVIGEGAFLDGRNGIVIGENVNISTAVYIFTEQHDINNPYFESASSGGKVIIGNRAWLSSRTTVLPKVSIGEGAVLASGGVATNDLESFGLYGGVPAKKIGNRNNDLRYDFDGKYIPFF